jgi:septum formation inhibitor MinC
MQTDIKPEEKKDYGKQATAAILAANKLVIQNKPQADEAATLLREIKKTSNNLEAKRKEYTAPLVEAKRRIDNDFKQLKEPFDNAEIVIKAKISVYAQEQERKAEEERKKAEEAARKQAEKEAKENNATDEEAEAAANTAALMAAEAAETKREKISGASTSKVWTFRITDANKVPRHLCVPDTVAIRNAVRAGERKIEGVEIYQETRVAAR